MKPSYVTFSVDDGHPTDLTTAELLQKYELKATFYIPLRNAERCVMSGSQIQQLGRQFEIGAHTVNHVALTSLNKEQAWSEVKDGKIWLENLLGNEVVSFCYPRGKFSATTAALVRKAGFLGARTCLFNLVEFPGDPFCWGVSTHAYNHSPAVYGTISPRMGPQRSGASISSVRWTTSNSMAVSRIFTYTAGRSTAWASGTNWSRCSNWSLIVNHWRG